MYYDQKKIPFVALRHFSVDHLKFQLLIPNVARCEIVSAEIQVTLIISLTLIESLSERWVHVQHR
jgi:hypothetical protein